MAARQLTLVVRGDFNPIWFIAESVIMASTRVLKGAVHNFLGTYTSRYTDFEGYWLFGLIVVDLDEFRIDLLAPFVNSNNAVYDAAVQIAVARFNDQVQKAGVAYAQIRDAFLIIQRLTGTSMCCVNGHPRTGSNLKFSVVATIADGTQYSHQITVVVAPHDSEIEQQSGRMND